MKRYLIVLGIAAALGAIGIAAGRSLRLGAAPEPAPAARPEVALEIAITPDHRIAPEIASVPKGHLVRIRVTNRGARAATLTLMGYEDRLGVVRVAGDSAWQAEFVADRPGDDFAWKLDGAPVGRLAVTGSHLEEGRR